MHGKIRRRWKPLFIRLSVPVFLLLAPCSPSRAQDKAEGWPEISTFVNLTPTTRFYFLATLSSDQDQHSVQGEFGPNFDFYLRPLLRRRIRNEDPAKNKLFFFRAGYHYLPSFTHDSPNEHRGILEATARAPLWANTLASFRSRIDLRAVDGQTFSWRFRERLTLEKTLTIRKYGFTPYIRAEAYYDRRYGKLSKNALTVGSSFPVMKHTEFELYYEDQRDTSKSPVFHVRGTGIVLNLYF